MLGSLISASVPAHVGTQFSRVSGQADQFCESSISRIAISATYESGIASYKNFYFNATTNTLQIWLIIVIGILSLYECLKYLVNLMLRKKIRYSMGFLFLLSIFSHYYGWWAFLNYLNDEFYTQWFHQMFFTVSI